MNIGRFSLLCSGLPCHRPGDVLQGRREASQSRNSRICAQIVMTNNERAQVAIPKSEQEKSELPGLVLFTPRSSTQHKPPSGDETNMEKPSWKCAYS